MDGAAVAIATGIGLVAGFFAAPYADWLARPRYAPGAPGHDPEDHELAPLAAPASGRVQAVGAAVAAIAFAVIAASVGSGDVAVPLCLLAWLLVAASIVDLQYLRLPDLLTFGGGAVVAALVVVASLRLEVEDALWGAVVGAVAYAVFLFVVAELFRAMTGRSGLGLGDVKLALSLGLTIGWLGWRSDLQVLGPVRAVIIAAFVGNLFGAVGGLVLTKLQPRRSYPFGPFLAAGWLVAVALV